MADEFMAGRASPGVGWSLSSANIGAQPVAGADSTATLSNPGAATLRRKGGSANSSCEAPAVVHEVLNSPGRPMDKDTRAPFEKQFGRDFSKVRIHDDRPSAESARAVNAAAYTVGNEIVLGEGRFNLRTTEGKRLLAHELSHVSQNSAPGPASSVLRRKDEDTKDDKGAPPRTGQGPMGQALTKAELKKLVKDATPLANKGTWPDKKKGEGIVPDWSDGPQYEALYSLVFQESRLYPQAQNRHSSAFGLFQFLNQTWAGTGITRTSDPLLQTVAGLRYIAHRYKTPVKAWAAHAKGFY